MKPNLFDYATSELSQDAFWAWYFMWADKSTCKIDQELHNSAKAFLEKYIREGLGGHYKKPIETIHVEQQFKFIDILLTINGELKIIVEDKIYTGTHSRQLQRYWDGINGEKLGLYIKTGDESADYAKKIENKNFIAIYRKDILEHFEHCDSENEIFVSFKEHWEKIENESKSYKDQVRWNTKHVIGFYQDLQKLIPNSNWHYAANPKGGDYVFNWHWTDFNTRIKDSEPEPTRMYLEFSFPCRCAKKDSKENFTECFKLKIKIHLACEDKKDKTYSKEDLSKKRSSVKWHHLKRFDDFTKEIVHHRPKQSRIGSYMTISEVSFAELINHNLKNWTIDALVDDLKDYEKLLDDYKNLFKI